MNTPTHILLGAALFGKKGMPDLTTAAILGGFLPDLSLYALAGWALFVQQVPPDIVFGRLYFSDQWMRVFAVDNSFILWGMVLGAGLWLRQAWLKAFAGAGLAHLGADFLLHHDDARPQFWPLSDWIFRSPVSYWDARHYGNIVAPLEMLLALVLCLLLWRRHQGLAARGVIGTTTAAIAAGMFFWAWAMSAGTLHSHG